MTSFSHLSVRQPQHGRQLFSVRFGDVLLDFKPLLQSFSLQVGEHRPGPRPLPLVGLWHGVFGEDGIRTWKTGVEDGQAEKVFPPGMMLLSATVPHVWTTWESVLKLMLA